MAVKTVDETETRTVLKEKFKPILYNWWSTIFSIFFARRRIRRRKRPDWEIQRNSFQKFSDASDISMRRFHKFERCSTFIGRPFQKNDFPISSFNPKIPVFMSKYGFQTYRFRVPNTHSRVDHSKTASSNKVQKFIRFIKSLLDWNKNKI